MRLNAIALFIASCPLWALSQGAVKKALFLGNSYTYVNNMPQITADLAQSVGDSLVFDSNTPGGYTLEGHSTNATSLAKIAQGDWDYVVLQEQSQRPSFPISQVQVEVFPYASFLDSVVHADNPCAITLFYMTWGRENGDAGNCGVWPPVCTYEGMDALLRERYLMMADDNEGEVSPAGPVWRYIRANHPGIALYSADGSHPSAAGSYAIACTFYTAIFRKDPSLLTYDYTLSSTDAAIIRNAAKAVAYDSLSTWNIGEFDLNADFSFSQVSGTTFDFTNGSTGADGYLWDMGDGTSYSSSDASHSYAGPGTYTVELLAFDGCDTVSTSQSVTVSPWAGIEETIVEDMEVYPIPAKDLLNLKIPESLGQVEISIYNSIGQEVMRVGRWNGQQVDVSGLLPGEYVVRVKSWEYAYSIQMLIQH